MKYKYLEQNLKTILTVKGEIFLPVELLVLLGNFRGGFVCF